MLEWSLATHVVLPLSLGLLGFIEPCAVGGHMAVLGALAEQSKTQRTVSLFLFVATRTLALGGVGIIVALIGEQFIVGQKAFWLIFGAIYIALGALYCAGKVGVVMQRFGITPQVVANRRGVVTLGMLLGLSVPACAAPLLFAVAASAAGSGAYLLGFITLALFGLALSVPLLVLALVPKFSRALETMHGSPRWLRRIIGLMLIGMGLWSLWFGLFVNPADWQFTP